MPVRLYLDAPWSEGDTLDLPPEQARHAQVLRLQPGDAVTLFNGRGGEWSAEVVRMGGRQQVAVAVGAHHRVSRELAVEVTLAVGMPANERMDGLIEKATELGVTAIQPLQCARGVLKLVGDRAQKRQAHWQAVAVAAAEQSGRTCVPRIEPVLSLDTWLRHAHAAGRRHVLSLGADAAPLAAAEAGSAVLLLSGPEGGLTGEEEAQARALGFTPVGLGARTLRADTAPLAALARLGIGLG